VIPEEVKMRGKIIRFFSKTACFLFLAVAFSALYGCGDRIKIKNAGNNNQVIVAFGDSLTFGQGVETENSYPSLLAKDTGRRVVNLGVSGETSSQALERLDEVFSYNPGIVIIEFGANDFFQRVGVSATVENIKKITDEVQKHGAVAVIVSFSTKSLVEKYTDAYCDIAREKGAVFIPGMMDGVFGKSELMSDNLHPNEAGYKIVEQKIFKAVKPYI